MHTHTQSVHKVPVRIKCMGRKIAGGAARPIVDCLTLLEAAPTRSQISLNSSRLVFRFCSWSVQWLAVVTDSLVFSWVKGPIPCEMMFSVGLPHFSCRAQAWLRQMVIAADRASEDWGVRTHREEVQLRRKYWMLNTLEISCQRNLAKLSLVCLMLQAE